MSLVSQVQEHNIEIVQNCTLFMQMHYRDENGDDVDLTGADIIMQLRYPVDSLTSIADWSVSTGHFALVTPTEGKFELRVEASETLAMDFTIAEYMIIVIFPDGTQNPFSRGQVSFLRTPTRDAI